MALLFFLLEEKAKFIIFLKITIALSTHGEKPVVGKLPKKSVSNQMKSIKMINKI